MAKNAQFNRQQVIENATNLFWEKGFNATSMRNLQEAIDMRPGSIYAAFGSKEGLFEECLKYYIERAKQDFQQMIAQSEADKTPLLATFKSRIQNAILQSQSGHSEGICFLVKSIAELTEEQGKLLTLAKSYFLSFENELAKLLARAQDNGEIAKDKDPEQLAKQIFIFQNGLRIYAKATADNATGEEYATALAGLIEAMCEEN